MAAEWQSRMSAITPVRRYFHWRGKQWPLIGICLPRFAPIDRVAEPKSVHAAWNDCAAAAATACLDLVATPLLADAAAIARAHGLGCVAETDDRPERAAFLRDTETILCVGTRGFGPTCFDAQDTVEMGRFCRLPVAVAGADPIAAAGRTLRELGRTADATCVHLDDQGPTDATTVLALCLAARLEDRPMLVRLATKEADTVARVGRVALAVGAAAYYVETTDKGVGSEVLDALTALVAFRNTLPAEVPEPRTEPTAVLVLDASDGATQPLDALLGALVLQQRGSCSSPRFAFQDRPDETAPAFVHVPAHGPLSDAAWALCRRWAGKGTHVLITGLTLDGSATAAQLDALGVDRRQLNDDGELPAALRGRAVLDTGGHILARRTEAGGRIVLLDRCIELHPSDARSLAIIGRLAKEAGMTPEPWLANGDLSSLRRTLLCGQHQLRADLKAGLLSWH